MDTLILVYQSILPPKEKAIELRFSLEILMKVPNKGRKKTFLMYKTN